MSLESLHSAPAAPPAGSLPAELALRPYQVEALEALSRSAVAGRARQLLVAPTGSGKTVLACALILGALPRGVRVLLLAPRKELIDQASAKLDACGVDHGVIMAAHPRRRPALPVQVASVQTLVRREKPPAELLIIDEAHHARARSYERILAGYQGVRVVGLTATPWRLDGKGLAGLFDDLVVATTPAQLIEAGYLVPFDGFSYEMPDLSGVRTRHGDYDEGQLELAVNNSRIVGGIVERWRERAGDVRTVVFAVSVKHSLSIVAQFRAAGVAAEHLDGSLSMPAREAVLARLKSGETRVVSNCALLTEGWDLPGCACCILARPTQSLALYLQQVGRILRPAPGKASARIHDHAGSLVRFGLPDAPRDYRLTSDVKKKPQGEAVTQTCPVCFRVYPAGAPQCPECGELSEHERVRRVRETTGIELSIEDLRRLQEVSLPEKASEYLRLCEEAKRQGFKPGWAYHRYREAFGEPPNFPPGVLERAQPASEPVLPLGRRLRRSRKPSGGPAR